MEQAVESQFIVYFCIKPLFIDYSNDRECFMIRVSPKVKLSPNPLITDNATKLTKNIPNCLHEVSTT